MLLSGGAGRQGNKLVVLMSDKINQTALVKLCFLYQNVYNVRILVMVDFK